MNTKSIMVEGFHSNCIAMIMGRSKIQVIFTSDDLGETLSFNDGHVQLTVPYEQVKRLISQVRNNKKPKK